MRLQFGSTWWGRSWLQSLDQIDYQNRLPRGKTYARKGAVRDIRFIENICMAKVQGTRRTPYAVKLKFPLLFQEQKEQLLQGLLEQSATVSKLLNRELSPSIMHIASQYGIKVFPTSWMDWDMSCSCPDWAVPCKHLASVVYVLSREIDSDPFLIFRLMGLDLLAELRVRNIQIEERTQSVLSFEAFLLEGESSEKESENKNFTSKFSDIGLKHDALLLLLPENPAFYHYGDFRKTYASSWQKIQKTAKKISGNTTHLAKYFGTLPSKVSLTKHSECSILVDVNGVLRVELDQEQCQVNHLIRDVLSLDSEEITAYHQSIYALYYLLITINYLLAQGLLIPQVTQYKEQYSIDWAVPSFDQAIVNIMENLHQIIPKGLVQFQKGKKHVCPRPERILCALFAKKMIAQFSVVSKPDPFLSLFFEGLDYTFQGLGESKFPLAINLWLERYDLEISEHRVFLIVSEVEDIFTITFEIEVEGQRHPLSRILIEEEQISHRFMIVRKLMLLSDFIDGLEGHINGRASEPILLDVDEFAPFLMNVLPVIQLFGIQVVLPKILKEILRPKPTVQVKTKTGLSVAGIRLDDLLTFDWKIALGDQLIDIEECRELLQNASKLIKFRGRYIYVDENDLQKILSHLSKAKDLKHHELLQIALSEKYQEAHVLLTPEVEKLIQELRTQKEISIPKTLEATLRPYQERGFSWLVRNHQLGFGSILADDMGLGKTLQAITLLLYFKELGNLNEKKQALVIAPMSLLTNWVREVEKFAPMLSTSVYHGAQRKREPTDIIFTSYGTLRSDIALFKKTKWQAVIIDEAQHIKTPSAKQTKAVKSLKTGCRVALSGTPVENRLSEFWSIMDFANKGFLGTLTSFAREFSKPIQIERDYKIAEHFQNITKPFLMRRVKTDKSIISDLPDKIEQNTYCVLTETQATLYQKTVEQGLLAVETEKESLFKRQGVVLQMILALKQICNHPTQFLKNQNKDALLSGKMATLFELLTAILERDEKVLIFTQFTEMGALLEEFITKTLDEEVLYFHGGSSMKKRNKMVDEFQTQRNKRVFILSLKAAGTGLNLTAASHVIHYDLWWNPAVESQATDRAYRIGQTKNVHVHRFICRNTFEEKIDMMIQKKKDLAEMTISTGENWIGNLSNSELREVFER